MTPATVSVRDARAAPADRLWIQSVYRDYLDDLNPGTGLFPKLGEVGHREPDLIAHWFGDPNTFPLVIVKGIEPVGFARVVRIAAAAAPPSASAACARRAWRPGHRGNAGAGAPTATARR